MVVAVQDEFRADPGDHRLESLGVGQIPARLGAAEMGRVMDQDDAEAGSILAEARQHVLGGSHLARADASAGDEGEGGNCRRQAEDSDVAMSAQIGKDTLLAVVSAGPGADFVQKALECPGHIGVMIARHEADPLGRAEPLQKDARDGPFARKTDIAGVARAGDVIRSLLADVEDELGQQLHVVHAATAAVPIIPAGQALAEQLPQLRARQGAEMGVCQMGKTEHGDP